jgi:hypothetical protein
MTTTMTTATIGSALLDGIEDATRFGSALTIARRLAAILMPALESRGLRGNGTALGAAWDVARDELIRAGVPDRHLRPCMVQFFQP